MFLNLRFRKIARDLWQGKQQAALATLAIGVSVFAVSVVVSMDLILITSLSETYQAARPPQAVFNTGAVFDEAAVAEVRALPGVLAAEGLRRVGFRVAFGSEVWRSLEVIARADYADLQINLLKPGVGRWPPPEGQIVLERSATTLTSAQVGDDLRLYTDELGEIQMRLAGLVYAPTENPSRFAGNSLIGYVSLTTLARLTGDSGYNRLYLRFDETLSPSVNEAVEALLDAHDAPVVYTRAVASRSVLTPFIQASALILGVLSLLTLAFSVALVVSFINDWLARERIQVGLLKALGFSSRQIISMYLGGVVVLSGVACALAIPLGRFVALGIAWVVAGQLNIDLLTQPMPVAVLGLELTTGLAVPLLATWLPIRRGVYLTVRAALHPSPDASFHALHVGLPLAPRLPPSVLYPLRNLARHKTRLMLTLFTLTLAGVIFVVIFSLRTSLAGAVEQIAAYWREDLRFETFQPLGQALIKNELRSLPGVSEVEARLVDEAYIAGRDSPPLVVVGLPPDTPFLRPTLLAGRWLRPTELNGLVIDAEVLRYNPDLRVGDVLTLQQAGQRVAWEVVGVTTGQLLGYGGFMTPVAYAHYHYLSELLNLGGQANVFAIQTDSHTPVFQAQVSREVEDHLHPYRFSPRRLELTIERRAAADTTFQVLISLVFALTLIFTGIGGLGLMSLMHLNVLERGWEIGVLRSLGGTRPMVSRLIWREALCVTLMSWGLTACLVWPVSRALSQAVGQVFVNAPLQHAYPFDGLAVWLAFSVSLAFIATASPIHQLMTVSVRDNLRFNQ